MPPTATWAFLLEGEDFDLEDFPLWLAGSPITVVRRDDGRFSLHIPVTVAGQDPEAVRSIAQTQLDVLNGIASILYPEHRPVRLSGLLSALDADGRSLHQFVVAGTGEVRMKGGQPTVVIDGIPSRDPRDGAATPLLQVAATNDKVQHALRILGRGDVGWRDLYLIFELVESDVGSLMHDLGWITEAEESRFTRTANSFAVLGYEARHAHARFQPPADPMSLAEAITVVRRTVSRWIAHNGIQT